MIIYSTKEALGMALGKGLRSSITLTENGFKSAILKITEG